MVTDIVISQPIFRMSTILAREISAYAFWSTEKKFSVLPLPRLLPFSLLVSQIQIELPDTARTHAHFGLNSHRYGSNRMAFQHRPRPVLRAA